MQQDELPSEYSKASAAPQQQQSTASPSVRALAATLLVLARVSAMEAPPPEKAPDAVDKAKAAATIKIIRRRSRKCCQKSGSACACGIVQAGGRCLRRMLAFVCLMAAAAADATYDPAVADDVLDYHAPVACHVADITERPDASALAIELVTKPRL